MGKIKRTSPDFVKIRGGTTNCGTNHYLLTNSLTLSEVLFSKTMSAYLAESASILKKQGAWYSLFSQLF